MYLNLFLFFDSFHHNLAGVYQVTRLGHEHCDVTEGELLVSSKIIYAHTFTFNALKYRQKRFKYMTVIHKGRPSLEEKERKRVYSQYQLSIFLKIIDVKLVNFLIIFFHTEQYQIFLADAYQKIFFDFSFFFQIYRNSRVTDI